jgi:glucosamine 6-phosphate synthetase-like amidotransferase/phosphosugar isomerase protein
VGLATELVQTGAAVLVVTEEPERAEGILNVTIGSIDRALAPAIAVLPSQLLAWRLAAIRGREPGTYRRATKVTTRE